MSKGDICYTAGYKYYLGAHFALCHGPIDYLLRIDVAERIVWEYPGPDAPDNCRMTEGEIEDLRRFEIDTAWIAWDTVADVPTTEFEFRMLTRYPSGVSAGEIIEIYDSCYQIPPVDEFSSPTEGNFDGIYTVSRVTSSQIAIAYPGGPSIPNSAAFQPLTVCFATGPGVKDYLGKWRYVDSEVVGDSESEIVGDLSTRIYIDAPEIFGGDSREGGVQGCADWLNGGPTQNANAYLASQLGQPLPAFRGVSSLVLNQAYVSSYNPYLKNWAFWVSRIRTRQDGLDQWYMETAACPPLADPEIIVTYEDVLLVDDTMLDALDAVDISAPETGSNTPEAKGVTVNVDPYDTITIKKKIGGVYVAMSVWTGPEESPNPACRDENRCWFQLVSIKADGDLITFSDQDLWYELFETASQSESAVAPLEIELTGYSTYTIHIRDEPIEDNRGGLSLSVFKRVAIETEKQCLGCNESNTCQDMNPIHIIRDCLTDPDWGMGYPEEDMDETSFRAAALAIFVEEMGISILWDRENTLEAFVQDIARHIDATVYVDRRTGKFKVKLIRNDYNPDNLFTLSPAEIGRVENYRRPAFGELINTVTVLYWDCETGVQASVTVQDIALVQQQGGTIGTSIEYPGFTNHRNASRAAQRDLRALSLPLLSCTIYVNRAASLLDIGDVFKFEWPDYHTGSIVMRITGMAFGDGTEDRIRIDCVEDVFATVQDSVVSAPPSKWVNPSLPPDPIGDDNPEDPPPDESEVATSSDEPDLPPVLPDPDGETPDGVWEWVLTESPYYRIARRVGDAEAEAILAADPGAGFLVAFAAKPDRAIDATLQVDNGSGFLDAGILQYAPFARLAADIGYTDTKIYVTDVQDERRLTPGTFGSLGTNEIIVYESRGTDSFGTYWNVRRGALDTVPSPKTQGAGPVHMAIYIWQNHAASDFVQYTDQELIQARLIARNGAGTARPTNPRYLGFRSRAIRPYPPGNFRINGVPYKPTIEYDELLTVSWSHRNRLQQTGSYIEDTTAGDIGPEPGTTYGLVITRDEDGQQVYLEQGITGTEWSEEIASSDVSIFEQGKVYRILLWSSRDGWPSWIGHSIKVTKLSALVSESEIVPESEVVESEVVSELNEPVTFDCASDQPELDDPITFDCGE